MDDSHDACYNRHQEMSREQNRLLSRKERSENAFLAWKTGKNDDKMCA